MKRIILPVAALFVMAACKKEKEEKNAADTVLRISSVWVEKSLREDTLYFEGRDGRTLFVQVKYGTEADTAVLAGWVGDSIWLKPNAQASNFTRYSFKLDEATDLIQADNLLKVWGSGKVASDKVTFEAVK
ncbi:hypothetical protein MKQ68_00090 [Chitinophaga horti]|uniref:Uncharacterized protein n=1 Tax=Chitinophaga horti TaxID=2920382 RepID=A0ABY6J1F7_9BACT|nr:hypothetical protein [Chitinophaga horti]UYQ93498.1 hypothetical protein MKQ68_00090 [Chitinophaga horti]